ncbi:MAG TPA: carboxypeptidase-like regulatory domain-containing protein [Pyrinomonadaceae bacterium]
MRVHAFVTLALIAATAWLAQPARAQPQPKPKPEVPETAAAKPGSIKGRVLVDGQAVNNASVSASRLNSTAPPRGVPTNDSGDFEIKGLDPGVYRLRPAAPGYVAPIADVNEETYYRVGDSVMLSMIRGGVITGKVLTANDEPLVAVKVRAMMIRDINGKPPAAEASSVERFTDDRGTYRIFGLLPGTYLVAAGGRGSNGYSMNAYDNDAPTYAPSSTRDTAAEISLSGGEEKAIDVHYRADVGHVVSGNATVPVNPNTPWITINLTRLVGGAPDIRFSTSQNVGTKGFEFHGVGDGEYLIWAQYTPNDETLLSDPKQITVKGADVTGIELTTRPLATVTGELRLEESKLEVCKEKRRPAFDEMLVAIQRNQKQATKDQPQVPLHGAAQAVPDRTGNFALRNLGGGQYSFDVRYFGRYWYLRSITQKTIAVSKDATANEMDATRSWLQLKAGDRVTGLRVTLAEGAASFSGQFEIAKDEQPPARLLLYLVPAEKESGDDVLRFFVARADADLSFLIDHVPPGRYWAITKTAAENESIGNATLRLPDAATTRAKIKREAEAAKIEIELKPCQNLSEYKMPLKPN